MQNETRNTDLYLSRYLSLEFTKKQHYAITQQQFLLDFTGRNCSIGSSEALSIDKCTLSTHISASSREECTMTVSPGASSVLLGHRRIAVVVLS